MIFFLPDNKILKYNYCFLVVISGYTLLQNIGLMLQLKLSRIFFRNILLLLSVIFLSTALFSQNNSFKKDEDSLRFLSRRMYAVGSDSAKLSGNVVFSKFLNEVLQKQGIYAWPFDSLRDIGCLRAPDDAFRIFNWNIPLKDGTSRYFGFILLPGDKGRSNRVLKLTDRSDSIPDATKQALTASDWYGALYYSILKNEWKKQAIYTLLAWDGYSKRSSRKIIDILTFNPSGDPQFGLPIFKTAEGLKTRVIFEFAGNASMTLRYDNQYLVTGQRSDGQPKTKKMGMIVADRLVPIDARLKDQYEYYVPAGDTYDAFIFAQGFWRLAEDVMVTNPAEKKKEKEAKPVEYNLLPSRK